MEGIAYFEWRDQEKGGPRHPLDLDFLLVLLGLHP